MRTRKRQGVTLLAIALAAAMIATLAGCAKKPKVIETETTGPAEAPVADQGRMGLTDIEQENLLFGPSGLKPVYFDFDRYDIRPDARETLKQNAELIRQTTAVIIQIAGHCDERGTQEYNLALGEKRALATREYLMNLGIPGNRMVTISYGEEMPADPASNEAAWAKNRRCEFNKAMR